MLGLCGGYQILGRVVRDPLGLEGPPGEAPGLGLLDVETTLDADKTVREVDFIDARSTAQGRAYEIHLGRTEGADTTRAPFRVEGRLEGAASPDGRVAGSYLHGIFASDAVRGSWLAAIGDQHRKPSGLHYDDAVEATLDRLAMHLNDHFDTETLFNLAKNRNSAA